MRIDQFVMTGEMVEQFGDVILLTATDGSILDANDAALRAYGRSHTEMLARNVSEVRAPETQIHYAEARETSSLGKLFETAHLRRDGTQFPVLVWWTPVRIGNEHAVLEIVHDVTEQKRDEQAIRDSEARYRALADKSPVGIFVSHDGRVVLANPACARMFGASTAEDLVGMSDLELFHPDSREEIRERIHEGSESLPVADATGLRLDGTSISVEVTAAPLPQEGEGAVQVVLRDITDRKQAEQELQFRNMILSTEQEASLDGILVVDQDARILSYNQRLIDLWHIPDEIVESGVDEQLLEFNADQMADKPSFLEKVRYLYDHPLESSEDEIVLADGRVFGRHSAPMCGPSQEYLGRIWFFRDITEVKRMQQTLLDTVTSITDVIGTVSEMRDPYTAGHQRRVAELAVAIARDMGMAEPDIIELRNAGLLHDVGKISVPAEILTRPGSLSPTESDLVRQHAEAGYRILRSARVPGRVAELVYQHHERCDGSGYPRGLSGDALLDGTKVLMASDVIEAMTSQHPYRGALEMDVALAEIEGGAGTLYDRGVADSCIRVIRENGFTFSRAS